MNHEEIFRKVAWKDLTQLSLKELLIENNLSIPWALMSWGLAYCEYYFLALPFSAFFFLTAFRQAHNAFHNSLGTNKFLTWLSLYLNSLLMLISMHAVKFNHMRHHEYCLEEHDHEGKAAAMTWYGALLYGPMHLWKMYQIALQLGNKRYYRNILLEIASIVTLLIIIFYFELNFLIYHAVVMVLGTFLIAFFAVWVVHRDTAAHPHLARTDRSTWRNRLTFNMFYHLEHHLFPGVPTIKLPELAERLDRAIPELEKKQTF